MFLFAKKLFSVALSRLNPKISEWLVKLLTRLMDFLEKHFNNIIKSLFGLGGAGLGLGLIGNTADTIIDGATDKFGFFARLLQIDDIMNSIDGVFSPYMTTNFNCTFLQAFAAFGCVSAINTIINSCAYALVFWLCIVVFKWVVALLPNLLVLLAKK